MRFTWAADRVCEEARSSSAVHVTDHGSLAHPSVLPSSASHLPNARPQMHQLRHWAAVYAGEGGKTPAYVGGTRYLQG